MTRPTGWRAMGIRDKPIAPGSPWQNSFAERLIGSTSRKCVDHGVALTVVAGDPWHAPQTTTFEITVQS